MTTEEGTMSAMTVHSVEELDRSFGDLLTIEQASSRLNMSVRYVRRLVTERRIAFHRLGRSVRFRPEDLAAFVDAGRVEPIKAEDVWRSLRGVA